MRKRFRLYIDESGDHTYKEHPDHPQKRYLCLTGVILPYSQENHDMEHALISLKNDHFSTHADGSPIIFHRKEIVEKTGDFCVLLDEEKCKDFNCDLLNIIEKQFYVVIAVVIDKIKHLEIYGGVAFHPYHYCMSILLERYCGWMKLHNYIGDVMAESRGKKEDRKLEKAYIDTYQHGTTLKDASFFQTSLSSKEIKIKKKTENILGLQFADLLAHPCKQDILLEVDMIEDKRSEFVKSICRHLNETKYNRKWGTNEVWFWGKYFIPNIKYYVKNEESPIGDSSR